MEVLIHPNTIIESDQKKQRENLHVSDCLTFLKSLEPNKAAHNSSRGMVVGFIGATLFLEVNKLTCTSPLLVIALTYTQTPYAT